MDEPLPPHHSSVPPQRPDPKLAPQQPEQAPPYPDLELMSQHPDPDPELAPALDGVRRAIAVADGAPALRQAARAIQSLAQRLVEQEPDAERLTRIISALNDALTQRVIELASAQELPQALDWCWISLGSEGRQEQTLSSDQDNGIIFSGSGTPDAARAQLLPFARRINETLDDCGFPLCRGQIMASNPQWCLSLAEWREQFGQWIIEGDPLALLNASIFFDMRALYGSTHLAQELAVWLGEQAAGNSRFLYQMTANALRREAPLGLLRRFALERSGPFAGTIDLKLNGATLFVDAARIYGLACGGGASNTADRLRLAAGAHHLHPADADESIAAFYVIQMLRLKHQHRHYAGATEMHNHVDPDLLDDAERLALLGALRQARRLQQRLALDYPGSGAGI